MTVAEYFRITLGLDFADEGGHPDAGARPLANIERGWARSDIEQARDLIVALAPLAEVLSGRDLDAVVKVVVDRINAISAKRGPGTVRQL